MTEEDFTAMYDTYADAIYRYFYFRVSDKEQAQDMVQETFTRVWRCVSNGQQIDYEKTFLFTVAHNLLVDSYRKKKSLSLDRLLEDGFAPADNSQRSVEAEAEINQVLKHLDGLDEKYSQVLLLRFVEDLGPKDIAEIVGESENNISVRINRGLAQLRQIMDGGSAPNTA
jgi:RNA polymerase sigma-70 factor (ECF subfamily)